MWKVFRPQESQSLLSCGVDVVDVDDLKMVKADFDSTFGLSGGCNVLGFVFVFAWVFEWFSKDDGERDCEGEGAIERCLAAARKE